MRNTIGKWLILIALLAYTVVMTIWADSVFATRTCSGIEVHIASPKFPGDTITRRGVVSELARYDSHIIGKPLDKINTLGIEKYLSGFNNFESVQCAVTAAGKLSITIVPMIPELRVFDGNDSYYINKDGKRIDANAKFYAQVPIVSGHFSRRFPPSALLPVARHIASDPVLKNLIMMIKADSPNDIILVPRVVGHVINLGDATDLPVKFRNLMLAYRQIMPYKGWQTYDTISVKFAGRIVATRRDKSQVSHTPLYEESIDFEEDANETASSGMTRRSDADSLGVNRRPSSRDLPQVKDNNNDNTQKAETKAPAKNAG